MTDMQTVALSQASQGAPCPRVFTVGAEDGRAVLAPTGAKPVNDEGSSSWTACAAVPIMMAVLSAALIGHRALRP